MNQFCTTARQCQTAYTGSASVCTNKVASGMRGPLAGSRNSAPKSAACGSSAGGGHTGHLYTTRANYAGRGPGWRRSGPPKRTGPDRPGGEWPDPFQNDRAWSRLRDCSSCRCNRRCIVTVTVRVVTVTFKLMSAIIIPAANHPRQGRLPF